MKDKEEEKNKSFWEILPGILTGGAALVTAIGGCLAVIVASPVIMDVILPASPTPTISTPTRDMEFVQQASDTRDCANRPTGSNCIQYADGYVWLVYDSVLNWADGGFWQGKEIDVALGLHADYYHVLGTSLVREVPKK